MPYNALLTLPISLTLSVFPAHACSDADGSGGVCTSVWQPSPPHSRRWCVITEQRRAEWSDWWGDCGLLTEVFVWPKDMSSHWHCGTGDWPRWAQTAVGQSSLHRMQHSPSITSTPFLPSHFLLIVFSRRDPQLSTPGRFGPHCQGSLQGTHRY